MTAGSTLLLPSLGAILAACGKDSPSGGAAASAVPTGGPSNPVTLPVSSDNPPIDAGLEPEAGPLVLYSFPEFFAPKTVKAFQEAFGVEVQITTFANYEEALRKLASGDVQADLYFPPQEQLGKVVAAGLLQPLNDSYLPNRSNLWQELSPPWYDVEGTYSVVNTITTTGVGWRSDLIDIDPAAFDNAWEMLWDPSAKGKVGLYDQYREAMAAGLYATGGTDPNTSDAQAIGAAKGELISLLTTNQGRFTEAAYSDLPEGKFAITHAFNGDVIGGGYFLPRDVDPSVLRYVWPRAQSTSVGGHIGTDNFTVLKGAKNPVLAHEFINFAISPEQATNFFAYIGVPVPQQTMTPDWLVSQGLLTEQLKPAILVPSQLEGAAWLQTLPTDVDGEYLDAWLEVQRA